MKKLKRSLHDQKLAGVCSGVAKYFDVDPVIIRLAFVISIFFGGMGFLVYLVAWLIMPEK